MNTITKEELQEKIRLHGEWLKVNSKGERLILINYDLSYSNLSYSNLRNSDLSYSDLSDSDLSDSDLRNSDLMGSNLSNSNLRNSNLSYSNLRNSNLSDSDLMGSNLSNSNLSGSNLDFSSGIPLSCGGLNFTCDKRLATQSLYHLLSLNVVDFPEWEKVRNNKTLLKIANMTHLIDVHDLPNLEKKEDQ